MHLDPPAPGEANDNSLLQPCDCHPNFTADVGVRAILPFSAFVQPHVDVVLCLQIVSGHAMGRGELIVQVLQCCAAGRPSNKKSIIIPAGNIRRNANANPTQPNPTNFLHETSKIVWNVHALKDCQLFVSRGGTTSTFCSGGGGGGGWPGLECVQRGKRARQVTFKRWNVLRRAHRTEVIFDSRIVERPVHNGHWTHGQRERERW